MTTPPSPSPAERRADAFVEALADLPVRDWLAALQRTRTAPGGPDVFAAADQGMRGILDRYHAESHEALAERAAQLAELAHGLVARQSLPESASLADFAILAIACTYAVLCYDELPAAHFETLYHPFALLIPFDSLEEPTR
jgi:hypothetical protein